MHIYDKYTGDVWNVIQHVQGATKNINKTYAKSLLSMLLTITLKVHLNHFMYEGHCSIEIKTK